MPNVGGRRYPYTPAGKTAARRASRRTGQPMGNSGGYGNRGGGGMRQRPPVGPGTGIGGGPRPLRRGGPSNAVRRPGPGMAPSPSGLRGGIGRGGDRRPRRPGSGGSRNMRTPGVGNVLTNRRRRY